MSAILEESPLSDNKMDISDTTNSLESATVSPVADQHSGNGTGVRNKETFVDDFSLLTTTKICNGESSNGCALLEGKQSECNASCNQMNDKTCQLLQDQILDNRYAENNYSSGALLSLNEKQLSGLTLASSHPLMSPTGTDSDSELGTISQATDANRMLHNFPDVIPNRERQLVDVNMQLNNKVLVSEPASQKKLKPTSVSTVNALNGNKSTLQFVDSLQQTMPTAAKNKLNVLRAHSPDLLSSGSEAEVSQYHAAVEANFQSVALVPKQQATHNLQLHGAQRQSKKVLDSAAPPAADDISSLDSISNHSFDDDEDLEHNLASLSPSSSLIDGLDDDDDDDDEDCEGPEIEDEDYLEGATPTNMKPADILPQYSAEDERRDSRNWQKVTLPDGRAREIDMKVIEPYKRVLSHGGYLKAGGHNAIVIFCACHLPDRSRADYHYVMDNLFLYVVKTLEQLVTEDYVLIYLHGGSNRRNIPPFPWLKKCYQLLDRRLRKSLKNMYLVHPTFWIKSIVWMARPFVSAKFWRKLIYVKSLEELGTHVVVERAAIPEKVKLYDAKYK